MGKIMVLLIVMTFAMPVLTYAGDSSDLLKEGLLGAGAGAVGGAASGAKGKDVWKGALAGAGVNIIGGALLDSMSGSKNTQQAPVQQQPAYYPTSNAPTMPSQDIYGQGYQEGFNNGYKQGYTQGYQEGVREATKSASVTR